VNETGVNDTGVNDTCVNETGVNDTWNVYQAAHRGTPEVPLHAQSIAAPSIRALLHPTLKDSEGWVFLREYHYVAYMYIYIYIYNMYIYIYVYISVSGGPWRYLQFPLNARSQ